jgi:CDP-6-deoxy-D-xylo-4-hexulose-3-dehydrase
MRTGRSIVYKKARGLRGDKNLRWPLMENNISRRDLNAVIKYLGRNAPILTQSRQVAEFEREWSAWLGVKHSVFVNSGSSANLLTMAALRAHCGGGEVIVPPLTWVSDIASVIQCGFDPVFVDINPGTLGLDIRQVLKKITKRTRAVFITHILGYNALSKELLGELRRRKIALIEDVCESYGATFAGKKLGTFGWISNFSFYYAHHMSTIEGGMVSMNDEEVYQTVRMLRSHGMVREATSVSIRSRYRRKHPDLNPDFIFAFPAYNMRSTEINAVIGRSQLKRLDENNRKRTRNLKIFLSNLDPLKYRTDFDWKESCNYAFTLVLRRPDPVLSGNVMASLRRYGVEFRRGMSGGGNQLRQPYLRKLLPRGEFKKYPQVEHVHFFGFYIGNYPHLSRKKILRLCALLNRQPARHD